MPARSAARLSRSPAQWHDHELEERRRIAASLARDLTRAREQAAAWYVWMRDRAAGNHRHELRDDQGAAIACPVSGCDAVCGSANPHLADGARRRQGARAARSS